VLSSCRELGLDVVEHEQSSLQVLDGAITVVDIFALFIDDSGLLIDLGVSNETFLSHLNFEISDV
jgi:hypothetical protein